MKVGSVLHVAGHSGSYKDRVTRLSRNHGTEIMADGETAVVKQAVAGGHWTQS